MDLDEDNIDDILSEFDQRSVPSSTRDLSDLTKQWIAERGAPEILPYQGPLLERVVERIREQVCTFFIVSRGDG